jgi:hypothetical protein
MVVTAMPTEAEDVDALFDHNPIRSPPSVVPVVLGDPDDDTLVCR